MTVSSPQSSIRHPNPHSAGASVEVDEKDQAVYRNGVKMSDLTAKKTVENSPKQKDGSRLKFTLRL